MTDATSIQNPTDLSDYDWLEFVSFVWKVENEGYGYAAEEYCPKFEGAQMKTLADDYTALRDFYRAHTTKVDTWAEQIGWEQAIDLTNAHVDEARKRQKDAHLWGIRCTDGYLITAETEACRNSTVAHLERNAGKGWREPAALLRREVPGGEWTEKPL
ncbi:hypothetical protein [Streptomyces sp. NPDC015125]|uniref:hypothetical protein n=1 Tax=Streptomyces sp. NPDC015125 TaxID=3364938 RepID=UPI0036FC7FEF